jgi:hypothetical protein
MFWCFEFFILSCGLTHGAKVWTRIIKGRPF